jgi:hypothetical protein
VAPFAAYCPIGSRSACARSTGSKDGEAAAFAGESGSLAALDPALPATIAARAPLARTWRAFERALDARIADAALTA